jgi:Tfp pilus assembly protein PilV
VKKLLKNDKGLTMVECVTALVLTTVAVLTIVSMQSLAWQGAGKSDYLGRAACLLQRELESNEYQIMRGEIPENGIICADKNGNDVDCEDSSSLFSVSLATSTPATIPANTTLLSVEVKWPARKNGIKSSIIVSPQGAF